MVIIGVRAVKRRWKRIIAAVIGWLLLWQMTLPTAADTVELTVSAKAAVLYETTMGRVLYEKNAHTRLPMASTTKLMTALVASELLPADKEVAVPTAAVAVEGSAVGLKGGDVLTVRDLLTGLLLASGNDAAGALALLSAGSFEAFAEKMNARAAELGMTDSLFVTPSGLDEGEHGASAYDMALLAAAVLENPLLAELCALPSATITVNGNTAWLTNHNRLLKTYEGAIGMKTGFTKKSGRCLVSAARRNGVTLIAVTLNAPDDWNDHQRLLDSGFARLEPHTLSVPTALRVSVAGGQRAHVAVRAAEAPALPLLSEEISRVTVSIRLPRFVYAPVSADKLLGRLDFLLDGKVLTSLPLTAAEAVEARPTADFFERFTNLFTALLRAV